MKILYPIFKHFCCFLMLLCNTGVFIMQAQNNDIPWSVFDAGFAVSPVSNSIVLSAAGQSFVGNSQIDNSNIESGFLVHPFLQSQVVGVSEQPDIPLTFSLSQNYPNPFNSSTTIRFSIPHRSRVQIIIYNILGQQVAALVNEEKDPGRFEINWNGKNNKGISVSSGVFFYRLQTKGFVQVKKLMMLK